MSAMTAFMLGLLVRFSLPYRGLGDMSCREFGIAAAAAYEFRCLIPAYVEDIESIAGTCS